MLVTLAVYTYVHEAQVAKALLEAHGVESFIPDLHMGTLVPHITSQSSGIRLQVLEEDLEQAMEILRATE